MTDTLPAVRQETGVMNPATYNVLKQQAREIAKSGLAPKGVSTAEKVLVIAMKGAEIGIPPMQALSHIHVIDGKPTMSAELMAALVQRAGHKLRVIETTAERCTVEGERLDDPGHPSRLTWSMDDAKRAGVGGKGPWRSYPAAMLRARAISALCRFQFADVLAGVSYVPEELGADVDEAGQIIEAQGPVHASGPDPEAAVEGEVVEGSDDGEEHAAAIEEVRRMLLRFPEDERPDPEGALEYAGRDLHSAHKALRRLQMLWEEREAASVPAAAEEVEVDFDDEDIEEVERMAEGSAS